MLNIKSVIKQKGQSVGELAQRLGMNQVSLSRIINGNPTVETLQKIAAELNVNVRDLFETNDNEETLYVLRNNRYVPIGILKRSPE